MKAMAHFDMLFLASLLTLMTLQGANAVQYTVTNNAAGTPGGLRFTNEIGLVYSRNTLQSASAFIWRTFRQNTTNRKNVQLVSMFVDNIDGVAFTVNNQIHVSAKYIAGYSGDVKREITGVLYHESTHVWQWTGNGNAPGGLIEGIADYVRLKAGYAPSHWVKPGRGNRWDQGYDVTARFLDYCNSLRDGFVAELNAKMKTGYSDSFFVELLGKPVGQLWRDYKATRRYVGDVKTEITRVVYHETTHIWQKNGNAPGGLIEGIADYVRLKAGYISSHWVKPGEGDKWYQRYDGTAQFLDYCNDLRDGFVADLNSKMRTDYSDSFFFELLGKSPEQLFKDYKANTWDTTYFPNARL